jgi:hypothetical protein
VRVRGGGCTKYKLNPVVTHSLKPPGDPTLEPMKWKSWFQSLLFLTQLLCRYSAVDVRAPEMAAMKWNVGADVECAVWNLGGAGFRV